ncbi:MAG: hypothetical protein ACXAD7_13280 [Candidatus Kariarchaeaceae archaeon]|jgi:hypothetical protein
MKKAVILLSLIFLSSALSNAQFNPVSYEVQFDYYDPTLESWFNLTMTAQSYVISSDNREYDGLSSDVNYFNWNVLESAASDDDFFNLEIDEDEPLIILSFTRLEQSNTIAVHQIPQTFDVATGWVKMLLLLQAYEQKILSIDYDEYIWPVGSQIVTAESYPEQYGVSVLFQRGHDEIDGLLGQNISLFAGPGFDMNMIEHWMQDTTYSTSIRVDEFNSGVSTMVNFPLFKLRSGTHTEMELYPLEEVTIMVITESGMALLFSLDEDGYDDFVFQSDIVNPSQYVHEYISYTVLQDDSSTLDVFELPIHFIPLFSGLVTLGIISRKVKLRN